eukprot:TRINITY_DN47297_c0_g1_i1.p1 TRINITY_DN47297_c0_g1~~TRINITY_DN47297_c0_g1_i1.p1  ORF type:complete len:673 (+),score=266.91 TRINITY_DN47297_c0_g1_i1:111-2129(+)
MSGSQRAARILGDVCKDLDAFLDPGLLAQASSSKSAAKPLAASPQKRPAADVDTFAAEAAAAHDRIDLTAKLEEAKLEVAAQREQADQRAERDAAALARAVEEKGQLQRDSRGKRQRADDAEGSLLRLRAERDAVLRDLEAAKETCRQEIEAQRRQHDTARQLLESQLSTLRQDLQEARMEPKTAAATSADASDALQQRNLELEAEVKSLKLLLEQRTPDCQLSAQLRQRFRESEEQLRSFKGLEEEVRMLRAQADSYKQECLKLRSELQARDESLRESEDASRGATLVRRDLEAFQAAVSAILGEAASVLDDGEAAKAAAASEPTPMNLSLLWTRCQRSMARVQQQRADVQAELQQVSEKDTQISAQLLQLRSEVSAKDARLDELTLEVRRLREENSALNARLSVLRESVSRGSKTGSSGGAAPLADDTKLQLEQAQRRALDAEDVVKSKAKELQIATDELHRLRGENLRLADVDARASRLAHANAELMASNRKLEEQEESALAGLAEEGFGSGSVKVLHLLRRPGAMSSALASSLPPTLGARAGDSSLGDFERAQAVRQLERFKKATKKYVQDFREGIYGLLGWKVEMKGDGSAMQWHLTSKFQADGELVFKLRAAEDGRAAEFDLLASPWAEQLQGDRQAMACLDIYKSVPGFLAQVTADLIAQKTLPG